MRRALAAIVLVALIARIAVIIATPHFLAVTDAAEFDADAVSLVVHHRYPNSGLTRYGGPSAFRPPGFPFVLAALYEVVGTGSKHTRWAAARALEAVLGAITVLLIALIAVRLFGRRVGLVAGAVAAVYPPLVLIGSSILSESLFIPLVLGSVLAALVHRDSPHRLRWAVLSGVLLALAELTRSNGFVLVLPLGFLVWAERPRWSFSALRAPAALLAAFLLTLVPWTIRNYNVFHGFVPVTTEAGLGLGGAYNPTTQADKTFPALWEYPAADVQRVLAEHPRANEAQLSNDVGHIAWRYIKQHPTAVLKTSWWNLLRLLNFTGVGIERDYAGGEGYPPWLAEVSVYAFWVLLALAAAGALTAAARRVPLALWGCPVVIFLTTVVLLGLTRYRSPADPFFILLAAPALVATAPRLRVALAVARWWPREALARRDHPVGVGRSPAEGSGADK